MKTMTWWSATHLRSTSSLPLRYKLPLSNVKGPHFFNKTCACARLSCFRKNAPSVITMSDAHDSTMSIMNNVASGVSSSTPVASSSFGICDRVHGLFFFAPPPQSRTRVELRSIVICVLWHESCLPSRGGLDDLQKMRNMTPRGNVRTSSHSK